MDFNDRREVTRIAEEAAARHSRSADSSGLTWILFFLGVLGFHSLKVRIDKMEAHLAQPVAGVGSPP